MIKRYTDFVTEKLIEPKNNLLETISNPNFSVVVPGGCNGNCSFCFWKNDKACGNYIQKLKETLDSMPSQFFQLSLTGGEPTLSPYFSDILETIDTDRWTHTVLTSNGTNLKKYIPQLEGKIQHVNISRHHFDEKINESVFDSVSVPSNEKLKELVSELNKVGIDVTYSAVLTEHLSTKEDIKRFIKFAKSHGVDQVFFRKEHGTLDPSEAEKAFEHLPQEHHNCPVCRNTTQHINETKVVWKASVEEPSKELGMIYEVVYNQNGTLSTDWEQELIIESKDIKWGSESLLEECGGGSSSGCGASSSPPKSSYGGCGSGTISSCGGGGDAPYSSEPTAEELRLAKLKERKKKVKKVVKKVMKELADDIKEPDSADNLTNYSTSSTYGDIDFNYSVKERYFEHLLEAKNIAKGVALIVNQFDKHKGVYDDIDKVDLPVSDNVTQMIWRLSNSSLNNTKSHRDQPEWYDGVIWNDFSLFGDGTDENARAFLEWAKENTGCDRLEISRGGDTAWFDVPIDPKLFGTKRRY